MDANLIMSCTGLTISAVNSILLAYQSFRKSSVEKYFELLMEPCKDLSDIINDSKLEAYFFGIIEKVSREFNLEKIKCWRNATINLVGDFSDFDFTDNFIRTLDNLSVFDITVLEIAYKLDFAKENIEAELTMYFTKRKVDINFVKNSIKRLAFNGLLTEMINRVGVYGDGGKPYLGELHYVKNELGPQFLKFITKDFSGAE